MYLLYSLPNKSLDTLQEDILLITLCKYSNNEYDDMIT